MTRKGISMFEGLKNSIPSGEEGTTAEVPTQPSADPPPRFGATRIMITPDPEQSAVSIIERPNDTNHNDYIIHISQCIRSEGSYYGELLTLLKTITPASQVTIFIGSPGGSLNAGAMIASAIRNCKAAVTTVAIGVVSSAAALVWAYGHHRIAADGSMLMFHMSSHGAWGNSEEIRIRAENTVRYVKEIMIDPLVEQGLLTADEAETIVDRRRDLWLDSAVINARLEAVHV